MGQTPRQLTFNGKPLLQNAFESLKEVERESNGDSELVVYGVVQQQPDGAEAEVGIAVLHKNGWTGSVALSAAIEDGKLDDGRVAFQFRKRVK